MLHAVLHESKWGSSGQSYQHNLSIHKEDRKNYWQLWISSYKAVKKKWHHEDEDLSL